MSLTVETSSLNQTTRDLCQNLLDQPDVQAIRRQIETFLADEEAKSIYETLSLKGDLLQQKQQQGIALSKEEIADFEQHRGRLLNNSVAQDFLAAQQAVQEIQDTVRQYVGKTFELGRVPNQEDFDSGSCGHGCGCHH